MATATTLVLPKPWPDFLKEVDAQLSQEVNLHCLGGFILTALYGIPRPTGDIEYIQALPRGAADELERIAGRESALCKKYKLFLQYVGIADRPENYESRLQELKLDLEKLELWALDPYDLLLSKVTRNSPKDQDDAKYLITKLKLEFKNVLRSLEKGISPLGSEPAAPRSHDRAVERLLPHLNRRKPAFHHRGTECTEDGKGKHQPQGPSANGTPQDDFNDKRSGDRRDVTTSQNRASGLIRDSAEAAISD